MTHALLYSRAPLGIQAREVRVETHLAPGLPAFTIVGMGDTAVRESRDRVRSALVNSGFEFPQRRITVSLAPADLPKDGGRFDLAIALGILIASNQLGKVNTDHLEFAGELSLNGLLNPVSGILPCALACQASKRSLMVARDNADEASLTGAETLAASQLCDVAAHLTGQTPLTAHPSDPPRNLPFQGGCLSEIRGQAMAKRILEIAAAGGHSLLTLCPFKSGLVIFFSPPPPFQNNESIFIHQIFHP